MPTNIIESSHELSDKDFFCLIIILLQSLVIYNYNLVTSTWVCSKRILSSVGGYYPAPLALLLVFAASHRDISDSCRRDFNLVSLICRLWNALSTSCGFVHVYRFSTIFAIDRVWFGSISMYSSWKRQLLLCESCFAEALELPLESFLCPDQQLSRLCTTLTWLNMSPFAESSFWYQALQLFRILSPWQEHLQTRQ